MQSGRLVRVAACFLSFVGRLQGYTFRPNAIIIRDGDEGVAAITKNLDCQASKLEIGTDSGESIFVDRDLCELNFDKNQCTSFKPLNMSYIEAHQARLGPAIAALAAPQKVVILVKLSALKPFEGG